MSGLLCVLASPACPPVETSFQMTAGLDVNTLSYGYNVEPPGFFAIMGSITPDPVPAFMGSISLRTLAARDRTGNAAATVLLSGVLPLGYVNCDVYLGGVLRATVPRSAPDSSSFSGFWTQVAPLANGSVYTVRMVFRGAFS